MNVVYSNGNKIYQISYEYEKIIFSIASHRYLYKLWNKFIKALDNSKHKIYFNFDIDQKEKKNTNYSTIHIFAQILKISNKK